MVYFHFKKEFLRELFFYTCKSVFGNQTTVGNINGE